MADDEVKEILRDLDLDNLIDTFAKQRINMKALKNLTIPMINELITTIGDRAVFIEYWERNFNKPSMVSEYKETDPRPILKKRKLDTENTVIDTENIYIDFIPTTSNTENENEWTEICSVSKLEIIKQSLPIKEILSKQKLGSRIITAYEEQKNLAEAQRNKICDIILTYIDERCSELSNDLARSVAKQICEVFPTEVVKTYYISPVKKKNAADKKSKASKGKLISMWRNKRNRNKKFDAKVAQIIQTAKDVAHEKMDEQVVNSMKWLEANEAPWTEVLLHWSVTYDLRAKELFNNQDKDLFNIFSKWTHYKHPQGYNLLIQDFNKMSLSNVVLSESNFQRFFNINLENCSINSKDDDGCQMLDKIKREDLNSDIKILTMFKLLPHLIPPRTMKKIEGVCKKPSLYEAEKCMIRTVKIAGDVALVRQEAKQQAQMLKVTLQPYIINVHGEDLHEIYVCVDDILYKTNSALEAIDVCFKAFHVFHVKYPSACEHLWILIQKGIYMFDTIYDTEIPYIQNVLSKVIKPDV